MLTDWLLGLGNVDYRLMLHLTAAEGPPEWGDSPGTHERLSLPAIT